MIAYEDALRLISKTVRPSAPARLPLAKAGGAVLARDITARLDMPRFDNSAMDGFGVQQADLAGASLQHPVTLALAGESRAGGRNSGRLRKGQALRIFTGAAVPAGVEAVIAKEQADILPGGVCFSRPVKAGENIRRKGEEYGRGAKLLDQGVQVTPAVISVLASQGYAEVQARMLPRVAVVVSGDELTVPGNRLPEGCIYDSNTPSLASALGNLGIKARAARVPDKLASARRKLDQVLHDSDFVLAVGGISVGDYDVMKQALEENGVRQVYWQLAIKPGKPNYFGVARIDSDNGGLKRPVYIFGLPGNPVAALVSFMKLVRPGIASFTGSKWQPLCLKAKLAAPIRKKPGRLEWVRAVLGTDGEVPEVHPLSAQGSHMSSGLAAANCLIDFPRGLDELKAGRLVTVEPINWGA